MIKTLTRHGNSYALIIDRAIMDLLRIEPDTPVEITTDGQVLVLTPVRDEEQRAELEKALKETNRKFGRALKKLAE